MTLALDSKKIEISPTQQHFLYLKPEELLAKNKAHGKKVEARLKKGGPGILNVPSLPKAAGPRKPPQPSPVWNKAVGGGRGRGAQPGRGRGQGG